MKESLRLRLDQLSDRHEELTALLADVEVISDNKRFRQLSREHSDLSEITEVWTKYKQAEADIETAEAMLSDPDFKEMAVEENKENKAIIASLEAELNILINETVVSRTRIALIHELFFTLFAVLVSLIKILVVCLFIFNQLEGSIGTLVALIIYIDKIYSPIAIFNVLYVQFKMNSVSFDRLIEFLELENEDNLINGYYEVDPIEFINLENISYSVDETLILDTIFLQFEKGKRYALIGESGAGKSTLVKLIVGLIKPTKGTIRFNQRNITELNFNSLYEKVTYISQDSPIFDGSLRENIIFDKKVSDDKVIEMLKTCRLEKYFNQLEHGLDEQLGEKGVKLSGGQKQRIAFARMAFSDSDLIILDEATSALDHLTEKAVMQNILPFFENKIVIFITHKMNFLESIDQIICLKNGLVIEEGSYDELIEKQGYLYELKQNSKKE